MELILMLRDRETSRECYVKQEIAAADIMQPLANVVEFYGTPMFAAAQEKWQSLGKPEVPAVTKPESPTLTAMQAKWQNLAKLGSSTQS